MTARHAVAALIVAAGVLGAFVVAAFAGIPVADMAVIVPITVLASILAGVVGAAGVRAVRGRPVRVHAMVVALSSLLVTVTGIVAAAVAMFISTHDLVVLLVVVLMAAAVAVGAAVQLGSDIGAGTRQVGVLAQRLAHVDGVPEPAREVSGPGELDALAANLVEVSERLAESRRREQALEASRRELIAWVSHDLRGPLATIRAMAEALDDDVVADEASVRRYHGQIRADAERLTALVDDLFELSRITSGTLPMYRESVGLADVIAEALAGAQVQAQVKGVDLVERVDRLPPIDVSAREFARALNNLLDNAIRHTRTGGRVVVEATSGADGTAAVLRVRDECGGIPDPDLARVFDIAFRGDAARGRDDRGGGLGLAITKGLVEAHDGTVEVANGDRGCQFTIRVPVRNSSIRKA